MSAGQCPSCGAPVEFRPGAGQVKVCEHCRTVVLRGEAKLENLGKVALLVDTESPLKVGLMGRSQGTGFQVAGRIQKSHGTGTWDEWCLSFDDGRTGWLSESEGEWNLMFEVPGVQVGTFASIDVGAPFALRDQRFVVEEKGHAKTVSAQGQLPGFAKDGDYIDATGRAGLFATIDYGQGVECFVGSRVTLKDLGFDPQDLQPTPRREALRQARCTQCNGPLDLKAPDSAKRVACPFCGALLDVCEGNLAFLQLLEKPARKPALPLGAQGTLGGVRYTVLAYLERSCVVEGNRYVWDEYLLYERAAGFRWLMRSNHFWTFLTPVAAGEVVMGPRTARFTGKIPPPLTPGLAAPPPTGTELKLYQSVNTTVDAVQGECYWEVSQGEQGHAVEYIAPPFSLNLDRTRTELTFTWGELIEPALLTAAFALKEPLVKPAGVASASPNPWKKRAKDGFLWAGIYSAVLLALGVVFGLMSVQGTYFEQAFTVPDGAASGSPESQVFSEPFELPTKTPLEVEVAATNLDNRWLGVQTDLVHEETGEVISLDFEASAYSGVEDGESWSETSLSSSKSTGEAPAGRYVLRATPTFENDKRPGGPFKVKVSAEGGGGGFCCAFFFMVLLILPPIVFASRGTAMETTRWEDSVRQQPQWGDRPVSKASKKTGGDDDDDEGGDDE